jgi:hypothetical protein
MAVNHGVLDGKNLGLWLPKEGGSKRRELIWGPESTRASAGADTLGIAGPPFA